MKLKKILLAIFILVVIAQFFGPEKNQADNSTYSAFVSETNPSEEVLTLLQNSCFDCHSNNTSYPWYSHITPVNYWMSHHVNEGKEHFNISDWTNYSTGKKDHKIHEVIETIENNSMPLDSYTWTHNDAILSDDQKQLIINWAQEVRLIYAE